MPDSRKRGKRVKVLSQIDCLFHRIQPWVPGWLDTFWYERICRPVADYEDALWQK